MQELNQLDEPDQTTDQDSQVGQTDPREESSLLAEDTSPMGDSDEDPTSIGADDDQADEQDADPQLSKLRKEAAKYRRRAQDAEAAQNTALDVMNQALSGAVGQWLALHGCKPNLLHSLGHDLTEFLDEDKGIDFNKVATTVVDYEQKVGATLLNRSKVGNLRNNMGVVGNKYGVDVAEGISSLIDTQLAPEDPNAGMQSYDGGGDWSGALRK